MQKLKNDYDFNNFTLPEIGIKSFNLKHNVHLYQ